MTYSWIVLLIAAYLGAVVGSFLNVVILRFISGESIGMSRSRCPQCRHVLAWYDLVPMLSFFLLGGKCRYCAKRISVQYPLVELVSLLAAVYFALSYPEHVLTASVLFIIFALLLTLFVIDLRTFILPDFLIVALSVAVIIHHAVAVAPTPTSQYGGVLVGGGFLLVLWLATRGAGIGFGDVKLLIPLGLLFGVSGVIPLLFGAFMLGGLLGAVLLVLKKATPKTAIPFGPFLAGMAMLLLVYPNIASLFWSIFFGI